MEFVTWNTVQWVVILTLLFQASRMIYRVTLHPLAKFPGPKLAGATNKYVAYFDLLRRGTLVKQFPRWHDQYGPIIRILPNQLHIRDIDAFYEVYKIGTKFDKDPEFYCNPFFDGCQFNISDLKSAKQRKDMFQPYFSKAAIGRLEPLLKDSVAKFLRVLDQAGKHHKVVDLNLGYRCLTADVIMDYCYQKPFGALSAPDFEFPLVMALDSYAEAGQWDKYFVKTFAVIAAVVESLPISIAKVILPPMVPMNWMRSDCRSRILSLKSRPRSAAAPYPTIFDTMLNPNLEKGQYTPSDHDLVGEAMLMLAAGMDTTANALVQGTFHILNDKNIRQKLCDELAVAMPDHDVMTDSAKLEKLPYLRAVIKESLRFSYGAPGRLPRVVPASGAIFCGQYIPPGTVVSQSSYVYHCNEAIFPNSTNFNPERWLGANSAELDKYMVSFSRGSRMCLGINLAYTELYLVFGHLFRRLDLALHETTVADMDWGDYFIPVTRGHLKVTVAST